MKQPLYFRATPKQMVLLLIIIVVNKSIKVLNAIDKTILVEQPDLK